MPVRITLDPTEQIAHPLRLGQSMEAEMDVSRTDGPTLAAVPRTQPVAQTTVVDVLAQAADAEVARVVQANLGGRTAAAAAHASLARPGSAPAGASAALLARRSAASQVR